MRPDRAQISGRPERASRRFGRLTQSLTMMVTSARIKALSRRIAEQFDPERIILFGSRANGQSSRDSDVDLLVVMRCRGRGARKAAEILNRVEPEFAVDLIVRTPTEMRRRIVQGDQFLADLVRRGEVLYESAHP